MIIFETLLRLLKLLVKPFVLKLHLFSILTLYLLLRNKSTIVKTRNIFCLRAVIWWLQIIPIYCYLFVFLRDWNVPATGFELPLHSLAKHLLRDGKREVEGLVGDVSLLDPQQRLVELAV